MDELKKTTNVGEAMVQAFEVTDRLTADCVAGQSHRKRIDLMDHSVISHHGLQMV